MADNKHVRDIKVLLVIQAALVPVGLVALCGLVVQCIGEM